MIRLAVVGSSGRMGREILELAKSAKDLEVTVTVDLEGRAQARDIGDVSAEDCDGVIDFSTPRTTIKVAQWCAKHGKFLVSGTTGMSPAQHQQLKLAGRRTAVLWAANMSLGVAALKQALASLSGLRDFDLQIEEIHHRHKKDKPSGTAKVLQAHLRQVTGRRVPDVVSIRGGGVRGVHRVWAFGEGEVLSFEHVALERSIFARGSLMAARWVEKKKPGLYSIEDLWQQPSRSRR